MANAYPGFEPEIVALCCTYCAYAAADLAGSMRLQYPANIKIVKLPCSGRTDIIHILKAFEDGADGVFIAGCEEGSCHFVSGNIEARRRVKRAKQILEQAGVGGERLEMFNLSAAHGAKFAEIASQMAEQVKKLGPSPVKKTPRKAVTA
ncbi:MAG: hydrogenase iron-sulfur subunit [Chloroflexi bacterium]|nr:hydrogenase iron-sulfur subunit [Chloroflexota bacterium]